jgi:hypothetical protein
VITVNATGISLFSASVTEIAIKPCLFFPALVTYCDPRTTLEDDALKGAWVRVDRDLNIKTGRWYLSIWYRRSRRLDVPLITSLLILADDEMDLIPEPRSSWHKAPGSLVDGVSSQRDLYLWYKLRPPLRDVTDDIEIQEAITEIDGGTLQTIGWHRRDSDDYTQCSMAKAGHSMDSRDWTATFFLVTRPANSIGCPLFTAVV